MEPLPTPCHTACTHSVHRPSLPASCAAFAARYHRQVGYKVQSRDSIGEAAAVALHSGQPLTITEAMPCPPRMNSSAL